ncbi:hypothetical protein LCGC14_0468890 [marine sediment metagenome]|uniref:Uncharacterized protein n=1 Tax=marine sediment metagenome TaxID=412755 RepID=A0A0F9VLM6_9ZZZZ
MRRRTALQQLREDDPVVQRLVKILQKVNRVSAALRDNLEQLTTQEANYLAEAAREAVEAYGFDWFWYATVLSDMAETSNNVFDLDEQAARWIDFLDDQYNAAMELDLRATELDYPDDHLVFQFVDKIEEVLNLRMDD